MRHALLAMAGCVLALSLGAGTADAADNGVKFKATRDIAVDSVTGKFRKPSDAEVEKLVADLRAMTRRPVAAEMASTAGNTGGITAKLDGEFGGVVLARPRADGGIETRCVFTFEEGARFLGLVADGTK